MHMIANAAFLEQTDSDYSFHNLGGTRGALEKGKFSHREIWNIFPFENTLTVAKVRGRDIPDHFYGHALIEPDRIYKVVTNSFVRDHADELFPDLTGTVWQDTSVGLREAVIQFIKKRQTIGPVSLTR